MYAVKITPDAQVWRCHGEERFFSMSRAGGVMSMESLKAGNGFQLTRD